MLTVIEIHNPFDLKAKDVRRRSMRDGMSPREVLEVLYPGFTEFQFPTICLVNGEPVLRKDWHHFTCPDSVVTFVRLATGVTEIIIAIIIAVVAVVVAVVLTPQNPALIGAGKEQQKNGDTVYSLSGERNQNRLNNSIEAVYGRNRLWPAYAARPYNTYDGNQQFQYSLFCLGHGYFKIEEMRFEDSPLTSFDDVEFEIVEPGESFDLFADNVVTSSSVAGIELFGTNEKEFVGAVGPFVTNAAHTLASRVEVDISLPAGLYKMNEENEPIDQEVSVQFSYQKINDLGEPVGDWRPLLFTSRQIKVTVPSNEPDAQDPTGSRGAVTANKTQYVETSVPYFYKKLHTLTPQRFTLGAKLPAGRYQVRAQRLNQKNTAANAANVVQWESLRAYLPSVKHYGDVTLVAIRARATNNLNNNAAQRFNVIATRKLPIWTGTVWTHPRVTRNPVWALCDIFRATYGGRLPDTFLDLETLLNLAHSLDTEKAFFDYIFDERSTVWEASRTVSRVFRAVPMLRGSQITAIRDLPKSIATHVFNAHNIVADSFTWEIKLRNVQDFDGIEVQYLDPDTWQQETVLCLIGDDNGDNPETVKLPGCSSRERAYHEGLYMRALQLYSTERITFSTGLEGYLPAYGDLVLISHDLPRWGTGGIVLTIDEDILTLSEPVSFVEGAVHRIILRKKDGTSFGPLSVQPGADSFHVLVSPPIDEDLFYFDDIHDRPYFLFGVENLEAKQATVVGLSPSDNGTVQLVCAAYEPRIYNLDSAPAPDKYAGPVRVTDPARPVVTAISVLAIPGTTEFVQVSWPPALGARTYVLDQSDDGYHWSRAATLPSTLFNLRVETGALHLRVAGVNVDIGPFIKWRGTVGPVAARPGTVLGLEVLVLQPGSVTVHWTELSHADSYDVSVFEKPTGKFLHKFNTTDLQLTYTLEQGASDGLVGRLVLFRVRGVSIKGQSEDPAVLQVLIPEVPLAVINVTADSSVILSDSTTTKADHT